MQEVETYVSCHQNTVAQFIASRPIMDLCLAAVRRPIYKFIKAVVVTGGTRSRENTGGGSGGGGRNELGGIGGRGGRGRDKEIRQKMIMYHLIP